MITMPLEFVVRLSLVVGLFVVALGVLAFALYGAFLGSFEDRIKAWLVASVAARPHVKQRVKGQAATPEQAADKAWERIKFSHGHGFSMVLAAFALLILSANAPQLPAGVKAALTWAGLAAMTIYNVGWALAGWLVPYVGVKPAKSVAERFLFVPFGLIAVVVMAIVALAYARQALGLIAGS